MTRDTKMTIELPYMSYYIHRRNKIMPNFLVVEENKCPRCQGHGVVLHPRWEAYWKKFPKGLPTPEADCCWFQQQGYSKPPAEEEKCCGCNGSGVIRTEVSLSDALDRLEDGYYEI